MESGEELQPAATLLIMFGNLKFGVAPKQPKLVNEDAFLDGQTFFVEGNKVNGKPFFWEVAAVMNRCSMLRSGMSQNRFRGGG